MDYSQEKFEINQEVITPRNHILKVKVTKQGENYISDLVEEGYGNIPYKNEIVFKDQEPVFPQNK